MNLVRRGPAAVWKVVVLLVRMEIGIWRSLFLWVTSRRPGAGPDTESFGYAALVVPVIWAFIGVSAVELVAVHLILARWPTVQLAALVVGVWGLLWMLGLLAGVKVFTHLVTPHGLRVRSGSSLDALLPWNAVEQMRTRRRDLERNRRVLLEEGERGTVLQVAQMKQTNVEVRLSRPVSLRVQDREVSVVEVHLLADEPRELLSAVRARLAKVRGHDASAGDPHVVSRHY